MAVSGGCGTGNDSGSVVLGGRSRIPADLQKGVAAAVQKFEQAFEQRDAKALAVLFTEEGEYVDAEGVVFHGRQVIANEFAAAFQVLPPGSMKIEVLSIRPVAQGVLVEDGVSTFVPKDPGTSSKTRFTATHVRQADGTWLRASVRELSAGDATPQEHLKALSWLLGAWRQESDSGKVDTEWKLSEDKSFLIGHFHSEQPGPNLSRERTAWAGMRNAGSSSRGSSRRQVDSPRATGRWMPGGNGQSGSMVLTRMASGCRRWCLTSATARMRW